MAEAEANFVSKAVATSVISNLVNRAISKLDKLNWENMEVTKKKFEDRMNQVQAVLMAVNRGQIKLQNLALSEWLWQFRDAVEEAEDAKILQDITKSSCSLENLSTLQGKLKSEVVLRKSLLVLDDVWRDDRNAWAEWEQILAPLKYGRKGSKILLTTRAEPVANMISEIMNRSKSKGKYCLKLSGLDGVNALKLLNKHAFAGVDRQDEYVKLHRITQKIAEKLGGCPLAAKVRGGVLNNHIEFEHWERIWKQDISNIPTGESGIMAVLRLSYHQLPGCIQPCFRFCSMFPYHHNFDKDGLVKMWMGAGLIQWSKKTKRPEDIGEEYFEHLIWKSIFTRDAESNLVGMHDLMHQMVISISLGECLRIDNVVSKECIPQTVRNLFIKGNLPVIMEVISHLKHLRSLLITYYQVQQPIEERKPKKILKFNNVLKDLRSLRLLHISGDWLFEFEMPESFGHLIHLRYICILESSQYRLLPLFPKSVFELYHLIIFCTTQLSYLANKEDKSAFGNFINLRHLDVLFSRASYHEVPRIGKMTSLQKLKNFCIQDNEGFKISELKRLNYLQELCIQNLGDVKNVEEAKEAKMNEKQDLVSLSVEWSPVDWSCFNSELILNNLAPHPHLQKLCINRYRGVQSPTWLENDSLSNLVYLRLYEWVKLESLPPLGKLSSLKVLQLGRFSEVKQLGSSFYGSNPDLAFQSLKELRISFMPQMREWVGLEN